LLCSCAAPYPRARESNFESRSRSESPPAGREGTARGGLGRLQGVVDDLGQFGAAELLARLTAELAHHHQRLDDLSLR
jgi:hypothetical protein